MGFTFELSKRKGCRASAVNLDMTENRTAFQRQLQHSFALPSFNSRWTKRLKTATKDSENELEEMSFFVFPKRPTSS